MRSVFPSTAQVRPMLYGFTGVVVGLAIGYAIHPAARAVTHVAPAPQCAETMPSQAAASTAPVAAYQPPSRPRSVEQPSSEIALSAYRRSQSKELMRVLGARLRLAKLAPHATTPEAVADEVELYLSGWSDVLKRGAPELIDEMASEIERAMCDQASDDAQLVVLARAVTHMPEVANARGLECLLERGREDFVMWSALDAWHASAERFGESTVLARVEQNARDERTLSRLQMVRAPPSTDEME